MLLGFGSIVSSVNQKLAELELSLYNLKQNVQFDAVALSFHPEIIAAAERVRIFPLHACASLPYDPCSHDANRLNERFVIG